MKNSFRSLIENKNIALVGPAKYMEYESSGAEIDDHDSVIRINRGIEMTRAFPRNVGEKTDILYSCLIEKAAHAGKIDYDELKNSYKVSYICAPPQSDFRGISNATDLHYMVNRKTIKELTKHIPVRIVDHVFHTSLAHRVRCKPNTGFMAIYDILRFKPRNLSIYGFSFYLDGFMSGCKTGIKLEKNVTEQEFANMAFSSKRHIQKNMWEYAKGTLLNNDFVTLDATLKSILGMNDFSRDEFASNCL